MKTGVRPRLSGANRWRTSIIGVVLLSFLFLLGATVSEAASPPPSFTTSPTALPT